MEFGRPSADPERRPARSSLPAAGSLRVSGPLGLRGVLVMWAGFGRILYVMLCYSVVTAVFMRITPPFSILLFAFWTTCPLVEVVTIGYNELIFS